MYQTDRYSAVPTYQSNQVVPLTGAVQQQQQTLNTPYGAFAPSTSLSLDARLRQEIYLKQKEYETSADTSNMSDIEKAYQEYQQLRNDWFQVK
jgi:hypothetical protein